MNTLQVGSFVINGQLLLILAFGVFGWLTFRSYTRRISLQEDYGSIAINAFVIWLLVWKGSLLLLEPATTFQHPITLIYYDGGIRGRFIAAAATGLYLAYRFRKGKDSWRSAIEITTVYLFGGLAGYHLGYLWFEPHIGLFHMGYVIVAVLVLLSFFIVKQPVLWTSLLRSWVWGCMGLAVIWFLNPERTLFVLSFSIQQVILMLIGIGVFIGTVKMEKKV
ncbi:hypothetical protein D3C73_1183390 [compost metagenome]